MRSPRMARRSRAAHFVVLLSLAMLASTGTASGDLHVRTGSGTPEEQLAVVQLQRLQETYDLQPWIFTREVVIESGVIPHSHPVLTLSTSNLDDDKAQLASLLHEQFHWYLESRDESVRQAMAEFARMFPDAPSGGTAGARNRESTYLHLIDCDLELQAMTRLVGEADARKLLEGSRHYTWIYRQVLTNPEVRRVNARFGLLLPGSVADATGNDARR
jgi:hypothetical protein